MDASKAKIFADGISVLEQFNATGVPTGTPESSQSQHHHNHPLYSKASHQMHHTNSSVDHHNRYPPIGHAPATSSAYDFPHNFEAKVGTSHASVDNVPVTAWSCTVCHKPYKTIAGLDRHIRSQHSTVSAIAYDATKPPNQSASAPDRNKPCICEICGNGFPYQSKLVQHMRVHTGKPEDLQSLPHNSNMKGPMKKFDNQGEKPFRCEYENCGKGFCRKDKLTRHMFIHTGERPFACSHCEKKFYRKDKLNRHERIHTDNKPSRQKANANNQAPPQQQLPPPSSVKQEVPSTSQSAGASQAPSTTTMVSTHYNNIPSANRPSSKIAAPDNKVVNMQRSIGGCPTQMMPTPADYIVCRFCGAQFSDRPTFDHHLLLHATLLGTKMPEPVKFYGSLPNS